MLRIHDWVFDGDGLERRLVGFVADALTLNGEVEEGLGAEVSLVSEFGDNHGTTARPIETFEYGVVGAFEWDRPDAGVSNNFGNELHDGHNDVDIHRHSKHPCDAVRV